jgi:hypothetical protein
MFGMDSLSHNTLDLFFPMALSSKDRPTSFCSKIFLNPRTSGEALHGDVKLEDKLIGHKYL